MGMFEPVVSVNVLSSDNLDPGQGTYDLTDAKSWSIAAVIGDFTETRNNALVGTWDTNDSSWQARWGTKGRDHTIRNDNGNQYQPGSSEFATDEFRVLVYDATANFNQGGVTEYINGASALYSNEALSSTNNNFNFNSIGATARDNGGTQAKYFEGGISEIILLEHAVTSTERAAIEGYLAHKYGLAGSLPTGHTYKVKDPLAESFLVTSGNLTLSSTLTSVGSFTQPTLANGKRITFYLPECQNPGTLTVELTYT